MIKKPEDGYDQPFCYDPFRPPLWRMILCPFAVRREAREDARSLAEHRRQYPEGLTQEQWRRYGDLGDPFAEYKSDDPRKYGLYERGTTGYSPPPGKRPCREPDIDRRGKFGRIPDPFYRYKVKNRSEFRRLADLGDPRERYDSDDPRLYGIYGLGMFGYERQPEDEIDPVALDLWDEAGNVRIIDTSDFTNEEFRRTVDLGDPKATYEMGDPRRYGLYDPFCPGYFSATHLKIYELDEEFLWEG